MKLSVVIPALNEAQNIGRTIEELYGAIEESRDLIKECEIIVIDDHSSDNTFETVCSNPLPGVRGIRLSRRSGSHMAIRAGMAAATGDVVLCISADGQDDPRVLRSMIELWQRGDSIVWALRKDRENESLGQRLFAKMFYQLLAWLGGATTGIDFSRADFYMIDRKVNEAINACPERNTSLFGLLAWLGFQQGYIEYRRQKRRAGISGWDFRSRLRLAMDWIIVFSGVPLKLMTITGFFIAGAGFFYAVLVITKSLLFGSPLAGWSSVMTAILLLGGGQIMMLGIVGEYLWRTLDEARDRPNYFIENDSLKPTDHQCSDEK